MYHYRDIQNLLFEMIRRYRIVLLTSILIFVNSQCNSVTLSKFFTGADTITLILVTVNSKCNGIILLLYYGP